MAHRFRKSIGPARLAKRLRLSLMAVVLGLLAVSAGLALSGNWLVSAQSNDFDADAEDIRLFRSTVYSGQLGRIYAQFQNLSPSTGPHGGEATFDVTIYVEPPTGTATRFSWDNEVFALDQERTFSRSYTFASAGTYTVWAEIYDINGQQSGWNADNRFDQLTETFTVREPVTVQISPSSYTVDEDVGEIEITVTMSESLPSAAEVTLKVRDGTATSVDYATVAFPPNTTSQTKSVTIHNDRTLEATRKTSYVVLDVGRDPRLSVNPLQMETAVTIVDDDEVTVGFNSTVYTLQESSRLFAVCLRLTNPQITYPHDIPFTVHLSYTDLHGVGLSGPSSLLFNRGNRRVCVRYQIPNDNVVEEDSQVVFTLDSVTSDSPGVASRVKFGISTATLTVVDDSDRAVVEFEHPEYSVREGNAVELCAVLKHPATVAFPFTLDLSYTDPDGVLSSGPTSLTFGALDVKSCVEFQTQDDDVGSRTSLVDFRLIRPTDLDRRLIISRRPVRLTVIDSSSPSPASNHAPTVTGISPPSPVSLTAGDVRTFSATASDPDDNLESWDWSVDGTSEDHGYWDDLSSSKPTGSVTRTFSHLFPFAGSYTVKITVTDSDGESASDEWTVVVANPPPGTVKETDLSIEISQFGPVVGEHPTFATVTVRNTGDERSAPFDLVFDLRSADENTGTSTEPHKLQSTFEVVAFLDSGDSSEQTGTVAMPNIASGEHRLCASLYFGGLAFDTDESNDTDCTLIFLLRHSSDLSKFEGGQSLVFPDLRIIPSLPPGFDFYFNHIFPLTAGVNKVLAGACALGLLGHEGERFWVQVPEEIGVFAARRIIGASGMCHHAKRVDLYGRLAYELALRDQLEPESHMTSFDVLETGNEVVGATAEYLDLLNTGVEITYGGAGAALDLAGSDLVPHAPHFVQHAGPVLSSVKFGTVQADIILSAMADHGINVTDARDTLKGLSTLQMDSAWSEGIAVAGDDVDELTSDNFWVRYVAQTKQNSDEVLTSGVSLSFAVAGVIVKGGAIAGIKLNPAGLVVAATLLATLETLDHWKDLSLSLAAAQVYATMYDPDATGHDLEVQTYAKFLVYDHLYKSRSGNWMTWLSDHLKFNQGGRDLFLDEVSRLRDKAFAETAATVKLAEIEVEPSSLSVSAEETVCLKPTLITASGRRDSVRGDALSCGRVTIGGLTWTSSDTAVVSVSDRGRVQALSPGTATITATSGGISGTATVEVTLNRAPSVARVSPGVFGYVPTGDVTFTANANDPDDNLKRYEWFVDGQSEDDGSWLLFLPTGTVTKSYTHTFSTAGEYTVRVTFTDDEGLSDSVSWTIRAVDPITMQIDAAEYTVNEDDGEVDITVTLSASPPEYVSVQFRTWDGTASSRLDYRSSVVLLSFSRDTTALTQTFPVTILDDSSVEPAESFTVKLEPGILGLPSYLSLTRSEATVKVLDDDEATVGFEHDRLILSEANERFQARIEAESGDSFSCPVTVPFEVHMSHTAPDGTSSSGPSVPSSVSIGSCRSARAFIVDIDDLSGTGSGLITGTTEAVFTLDRVTSADSDVASRVKIGEPSTLTVTIQDADEATVRWDRSYALAREREQYDHLCVIIEEQKRTSRPFTVHFSYTDPDGALSTGSTIPSSVRFNAGDTKQCVNIALGDVASDPASVMFTLDSVTSADSDVASRVTIGEWSRMVLEVVNQDRPKPKVSCADGGAVADATNTGLVADCDALLDARGVLETRPTLDWSADTPVAEWEGVTLGGTSERVTGLDLGGKDLDGTIPAELGSLTNLVHLGLSGNQLTGEIPGELGGLTNLQTLWLSGNQLTGCIPNGLRGIETNDLSELGLPFCDMPGAPTIATTIVPGDASLTVAWAAPINTGSSAITAYDLRYIETGAADKSDANWTVVEDVWAAGSGSLQYTLSGLTGGTQYDVQVRAVNAAGASAWSAAVTGTTAVTDGDPLIVRYDANGNRMIEKNEVIAAINDYLFGEGDEAISKSDVIKLINLYLFG